MTQRENTQSQNLMEKEITSNDTSCSLRKDQKQISRVLILQGPVGPFFKYLQQYLERNEFRTWRVCFNFADFLFSGFKNCFHFRGDLEKWHHWLLNFVKTMQIDCIILFGSERKIHSIARQIAKIANISVISLEEGYIRPGFITVENEGNNASSPLARKFPQASTTASQCLLKPKDFKSTNYMIIYGAIYYTIRAILSFGSHKKLFHRNINFFLEIYYWSRNFYRWLTKSVRNYKMIERLVEHYDKKYYLIPLQVTADSNLKYAAMGWDTPRLIYETIQSFALEAPVSYQLIFKIHPLERGHNNHAKLIEKIAKTFGVSNRVDTIHVGSLGLLARHAAGMITINSTSGLSAIFHGTPLLVIGDALYAHPKLAICAKGVPDFKNFWLTKHVANKNERMLYLNWIKNNALKPGDFYTPKGIKVACYHVLSKLQSDMTFKQESHEERLSC